MDKRLEQSTKVRQMSRVKWMFQTTLFVHIPFEKASPRFPSQVGDEVSPMIRGRPEQKWRSISQSIC